MQGLKEFIKQSNLIEGILRAPYQREITATEKFLQRGLVTLDSLVTLVKVYQPEALLRSKPLMNVRVGSYFPPPGGPKILEELHKLLSQINEGRLSAYESHHLYESLHPFLDANGRSGRAIWAKQMLANGKDPFKLGFLHNWYYQSLENARK